MTGLRVLHAFSTRLSILNPLNITWSIDLNEMYLGFFQPTRMHEYTFRGLQKLRTLSLEFSVEYGRSELFLVNQKTLHHLSLKSIVASRPALILESPNLKTFRYQYNSHILQVDWNIRELSSVAHSIESVILNAGLTLSEIFEEDRTTSVFTDMPKLIYLDLSVNDLVYLMPATFKNLSSLKMLDLSSNELKTIAPDAFMHLISLETLNVSRNALFYLPDEFAINLMSIQNHYFKCDELRCAKNGSFPSSTALVSLILANNRFVEFNRSTFQPLISSLKSIDISGNELECNCKLEWLVQEFGKVLINEAGTICSSTSETLEPLRGKPLTTLNVDKYCGLPIRLYLGISVAVLSLFVLSVVFIIAYHYRWLLRYKLFLLKLAILGYREIQDGREREEFEFDINIMFFDGDEEWATNNLRPELDGRLPDFGRIAFGDDELILGKHYFDAVYHNVEKSFKTILLLSRAAVQDHIFMTKFRIAMNHVTDTETQNLILVFLGHPGPRAAAPREAAPEWTGGLSYVGRG